VWLFPAFSFIAVPVIAQINGTSLLPLIWGRLADESFMNLPLSPLFVPIGQLYVAAFGKLPHDTVPSPSHLLATPRHAMQA
jgi:hypothetical protein